MSKVWLLCGNKGAENRLTLSCKELVKGGTQSVIHGAIAGTEPYIAGVLNETINLPKKVYGAKSINDIYNLYKDTGKDLTRTKNDYKQAYEELISDLLNDEFDLDWANSALRYTYEHL